MDNLYSEWEVIYKSVDTNVHGWYFSLSDCHRVCNSLKIQEHQKPRPTETEVGHVEFIFEAPNFDPHPVLFVTFIDSFDCSIFTKLSSGNIQKAIENGDLVRGFTH